MTTAISEKLVAAWNTGDITRIAACYSANTKMIHPMVPEPLQGRAAVQQFEGGMFSAFSSIDWRAVSVLHTGDAVAVEFRVTATNTAPMQTPKGPIPATNKTVDLRGVSLLKLDAQGLIAEERRYFDTAAMFVQLGLAG